MDKWCRVVEAIDGTITRRMRFACWITKATNSHSEYVILNCFSAATVVTRTRLSVNVIRTLPVLFEFSEGHNNSDR